MIKRLKENLLAAMKNKTKFLTLVLVFIILVFYCLGYLHYRRNRYLIHRKSYTEGRNIHRIARGSTGKYAFLLMLSGKRSEDAIEEDKKVRWKIESIYYFYYPCSLLEETFWYIVDE